MAIQVRFPQSPIFGPDGYVTLEWQQWLLNPQVLTINFAIAVDPASGGTGLSSYTPGDLLVATGITTLAQLHDVVVGNVLQSGGVGNIPFYGKVDLTTTVTGILPPANGGTGGVLGTLAFLNSPLGLANGGTGQTSTTQTYTPTLTSVTNVAASTAFPCQYLRVGNVVTVSGKVDVDPTAIGQVQLGISLPVPTSLSNDYECGGTAFTPAVAGQGAAIYADSANDRAQMEWVTVDTSNRSMFFSFTYQVI